MSGSENFTYVPVFSHDDGVYVAFLIPAYEAKTRFHGTGTVGFPKQSDVKVLLLSWKVKHFIFKVLGDVVLLT